MVRHLLFDLDNTLYPKSAAMNGGITRRMLGFVAEHLQVPPEEACARRKDGLARHGTTLEWLCAECGLSDRERYFAAVHPPQEIREVPFDAKLRPLLASLKMPLSLLTNAPYEHAERILKKLKVLDLFQVVVDLRANNFCGKPHPQAYMRPIQAAGFSLEETLFLDDAPKYVEGFAKIGGKALLIDEDGSCTTSGFDKISSVYELPTYLEKLW